MKLSIYIILILLGSVSSSVYAKDMSGWSDKTLCRLHMQSDYADEYLAEIKVRNTDCLSFYPEYSPPVLVNSCNYEEIKGSEFTANSHYGITVDPFGKRDLSDRGQLIRSVKDLPFKILDEEVPISECSGTLILAT